MNKGFSGECDLKNVYYFIIMDMFISFGHKISVTAIRSLYFLENAA